MRGNYAWELNEHNIDKFKGISKRDNSPYAQFFKGAYAYADMVNRSAMPFVSGMHDLNPFQLDAPIIAGKPFFDFTSHYFEILKDIRNNDKYVGYFVNGNEIVKTLDLPRYRNGVGNRITRKLFDLAALLYVDRFCPDKPTQNDLDLFEQFLVMDFIWAYSLRAQYYSLGWTSAQKFIMGNPGVVNSFNLYKCISESPSPTILLSELANRIKPLPNGRLAANAKVENIDEKEKDERGIFSYYLHYFKTIFSTVARSSTTRYPSISAIMPGRKMRLPNWYATSGMLMERRKRCITLEHLLPTTKAITLLKLLMVSNG